MDKVVHEFSATDIKIVEDSVVNFQEWLEAGPVNIMMGKVNDCLTRLLNDNIPKLISNNIASMPTDKKKQAELIFKQSWYKNRATRQAELDAAREAEKQSESTPQ